MPQNPGGESLLERLPPEILGLIFDCSDPDDFVALSLCSRTLWANAIRWAQIGYLTWKKAYSLAGTPLIYANSRLKALPQSIYDVYPEAAPTEKPEETETRVSAWHKNILLQSHRAPFPYYEHYINSFEKVFPKAGITPGEFENMKSLFPTMEIKKDSKWLLCNKTNKEFIRMEAVVTYETEKTVSHVGNPWLTLDILLLWLIGWRGDTPQDPWAWEELEDFDGIPEEELQDILNDPTATLPDDDFWPTEIGNWAGHSLEVVTDRQLNSRWLDRTECIDRLAPKMLRTIYAFAKTEGTNSARDYWKRVFERGNTNDEVSPLMQGMNLT